jgi:hypothetical protein
VSRSLAFPLVCLVVVLPCLSPLMIISPLLNQ